MQFQNWLLCFHPEKFKVLDISLRDRLSYKYYLEKVKLGHPGEEKDIGVYIENQINTHTSTNVNKSNTILGATRRSFSYLDKTTLLLLH